ncbi:DUF294 nucleotidyltransferase-like domain-containing protein [Sporosarcina sp. FSL K6-1522]|uniref:DUF294 nucleotidyltransferase-like domain-containing protein n=1 Tax=Sporosarcina sp. FSL K6-1522 TaxID=2921554 RepID=UPI003159F403
METSEQREFVDKVHDLPLFKGVSDEEFTSLLAACKLTYYRRSEKVDYFQTPNEGLFIILRGMAEISITDDAGTSIILEAIQEGEIIGFSNIAYYLGEVNRPLDRHHLKMEVLEDSYCLQIPFSVVKQRLAYEAVRDALLKNMSTRLANVYASLGEQAKSAEEWGVSTPYVRRVEDLMNTPAITVYEDAAIEEIARIMVERSISSLMVVDQHERLTGIITEKDLVQRVIAQGSANSFIAKEIMTKKLYTVSRHDYYYEVLATMYKYGVKHLPVVEGERLVGVVTLSNLLSKRDRGSMGILKTIEEASFNRLPVVKAAIYDVLSNLISDDISTIHTLEIITKLYDRLARHCVQSAIQALEQQGLGLPPVPFGWYQMGSGARGEQFMLTDQDHFLVYADVDEENAEQIHHYFAMLGEEIVVHLEQAGYTRCFGKMMSSEAIWRGSISQWQQRLRTWALKATDNYILLGYNFLSFRFLYGNASLDKHFSHMVQEQLKKSQTFLYYMAQQEQNKPIPQASQSFLALFKGKGKREVIDIKKHALFPLHHCLQILGVHKNIINRTPLQLVDGLVEKGELSVGFADDIRHAYEVALRTRIQMSWKKHLRNEKITTEIQFESLRQWERDELRTMLTTVHTLQTHLLAKL